MKRLIYILLIISLVGCGEKKEITTATGVAATKSGPDVTRVPDAGKIEMVEVTAQGSGITPGAAVNEALKSAINQVDGTTADSISDNVNMFANVTGAVDVETNAGKDSAKVALLLQGQDFAEQIVSQSKGAISSFKVEDIQQPKKEGEHYLVEIAAQVAKFKATADSEKIRIVVAPLRSTRPTFNIGGREIPAAEVLEPVRQQLIDSLTRSGRFAILDRQIDSEIQEELGLVASGQATITDMAKLSQVLSADLIWVGVVDNLAYEVRKLQTSDKSLVRFWADIANGLAYEKRVQKLQTSDGSSVGHSGSWAMSHQLVNLATRQVMFFNTLSGKTPSVAPATLGANFNETSALKNLQSNIVKKVAETIILKTPPVSIVKDG